MVNYMNLRVFFLVFVFTKLMKPFHSFLRSEGHLLVAY